MARNEQLESGRMESRAVTLEAELKDESSDDTMFLVDGWESRSARPYYIDLDAIFD